MTSSSWVIVHVKTGRSIFEMFRQDHADSFVAHHPDYKAVPILEYLQCLNDRVEREGRAKSLTAVK